MTMTNNTAVQDMTNSRQIDFMSKRKIAIGFSSILVTVALFFLVTKGLTFGLDFTGGTLIEVGYSQPANLKKIRGQLEDSGFTKFTVVNFGTETDVLIRMQESKNPLLGDQVLEALRKDSIGVEIEKRRIDYVGPQVGGELRDEGGLGMLASLIVMMIYVAIRFQAKFAVGAVTALGHDVIITLGAFALFDWDFDLTVLAAILAVIGYSLNDTIVVSDRIRENFRKIRRGTAEEIINTSLNQTLGRTIITSLTTLMVLLALFMLGGELIHGFATALLAGVIIGTYSSIYVASSVLVAMGISKEDLAPVKREGVEEEEVYKEV